MANPPRGGDAKPEVSPREIARPPTRAITLTIRHLKRRTRMSKFKLRHLQLMLSILSLVALVVVSGAAWKF
jgi:hypothetical protein